MNQGMLKPALIGGVVLGILSALPLVQLINCFCCAWVIGGGMLAANLYIKSSLLPVTLGRGVGLGLLTGGIGAVIFLLFTIPMIFLERGSLDIAGELREVLERLPNVPPELQESINTIASGGAVIVVFLILTTMLFWIAVYGIMGAIGGAIGVALFEKRRPDDPLAPYTPTEPPYSPPPPPPIPPEEPPTAS